MSLHLLSAGLILVSALLFSSSPAVAGDRLPYAFTPPQGWTRFKAPGVDDSWTRMEQKDAVSKTVTLLVHTHKNDKPYEFKGANREQLISIVQKTRGYLLRMAGLSDWTIDESSSEELQQGNALRLKLRGHYRGVKNQAVEFYEWAYFIGDRYYQFSYHQPPLKASANEAKSGVSPLLNAEAAHQLLGTFTPEGL